MQCMQAACDLVATSCRAVLDRTTAEGMPQSTAQQEHEHLFGGMMQE